MKITVDFTLCQSNGLCEAVAPEVFSLDEQGFLQLATDEAGAAILDQVERAVAACPMGAISLD